MWRRGGFVRYRGKRGPARGFKSLGSVLPRVIRGLRLEQVVATTPAVTSWPKIVGPRVAQHTRAIAVEGKTLVVAVDNQAWMTQLTFLKPQLIRKVEDMVGKGRIDEIRLVAARQRPGSS